MRAGAAVALALWAGAAAAQSLTVKLPAAQAPLVNAMTVGVDSAVQFEVSHSNNGRTYTQLDFRPPTTAYTLLGGSGPSGWSAPKIVTVSTWLGSYTVLRFTAACGGGLAKGVPTTFTVKLRPVAASAANPVTVDFTSSAFTVTASTGTCSTRTYTATGTQTAPIKVLSVSGAGTALQQLGPPAVVVWTITNQSSTQAKTGVRVSPIAPGQSCGPSVALGVSPGTPASPNARTVRCTYTATGGRSYTFGTNAAGSPATSTAVGATIGPIDVGAAVVTWPRSTLVRGRVRDPVTIVVNNASRATVARLDLITTSAGFGVSSADATDGALAYSPGQSSSLDFAFTGAIDPGQVVTLNVRFGTVPSGAGPFPFQVKLTPTTGVDYAITSGIQNVTVQTVTFPPDVSGLTIHSNAAGQTLAWTNPASGHAGVAIFRAAPPAVPSLPIDYVDYSLTPGNGSVYANRTDPTVRAAPDLTPGAFNYLVCNHDANLVYSECRTDVSARVQYLGNSAIAPAGGWTDQMGGEALSQLQVFAAGRTAVPTSRGDVSVVNLADGSRAPSKAGLPIAPVSVTTALPSTYMPAWRLGNGMLAAVAADQGGWVTAIDLEAGSVAWHVQKQGESFTAGASGVSSTGGTAAFKAAYPNMDVLFLGSSTTGRVYAVDASSGATLWTVETGSTVDALISYDAVNNELWVPTAAGVQAWDLAPSGPNPSTPPRLRWSAAVGPHSMYCVRTTTAALMACVDNGGTLRVLDKLTGAVKGSVATGVVLPSTLVRAVSGTPGFILGSARGLVRVVAADTAFASLSVYRRWEPAGWTCSPAILFPAGFVVVSASDLTPQGFHLYKVSSDDLQVLGASPDVHPANASSRVGGPSFDSTNNLYFFGTEEGRVWAIPSF